MARELYNWDQLRAYSIIALIIVKEKNRLVDVEDFVKELDLLQTLYGKEEVIGLANRKLKK